MDLFKRAIQKYYTDFEDDNIINDSYEIIKDEPFDTDHIGKAFKLFLMASMKNNNIDIKDKIKEFSKKEKNPPAEAVFFIRDAFNVLGAGVSANNVVLRHFGIKEVSLEKAEGEGEGEVEEGEEANAGAANAGEANAGEANAEEVGEGEEAIKPVSPIEEKQKEISATKFPNLVRQDNFPPPTGGSKALSKGRKGRKGRKTRRASSLEKKKASKRTA
jgi:hypothetical protein